MHAQLFNGETDRAALNEKITRFTHTANTVYDIRHARLSGDPPKNPMELKEAKEVIRDLVALYLKYRMTKE